MSLPEPYFQDDAVTIYHGDARELLPELKADVVITDPPYGVGINYASYTDDLESTTNLVLEFVRQAVQVAPIVLLTAGKWETELALYQQLPPRWRMCWFKGSQSTASPVGFNDWEAVLVYGDKVHKNAHDYFYAQPEPMGNYGHPCPKPLRYATYLISRFTEEGQTVIDPFMGSGTTLRAAKDLGRKAIGIEIEERYCEIAAKRMAQGVLL